MTDRIKMPDGCWLGYAEYGNPTGKPVIFFHGVPSSRLFRHPDDSITSSLGVHLITIDRPSFGLSDFQPSRSLLDWPDDVETSAKVHIWHGTDDSTPLVTAQRLADRIPDRQITIIPGKGHFLIFDHWKEILTTLISTEF